MRIAQRNIPAWRWLTVAIIFVGGALAVTWPLARHMVTHLPLGTENSATVPLFNLWVLEWHTQQAQVGYQNYWEAPIFYPTDGAIAFSEHHLIIGGLYTALRSASQNPVTAYNLLLLVILALNGLAAYSLARHQEAEFIPAVIIGWLAQCMPFVQHEIGVLQLTIIFPIFFALQALFTLRQDGGLSAAFALSVWCALTVLTNGYYGVFLALLLVLSAVFVTLHGPRRELLMILVAGVLTVSWVLPVVVAQSGYTARLSRSAETIQRGSAQWVDYTERHPATLAASERDVGSIQHLYPGTGILLVGILGIAVGLSGADREWATLCGVWVIAGLMLSLGLNLRVMGWQPYDVLASIVPGMDLIRSPFRAAVFVPIGLLACASYGVGWLLKTVKGFWAVPVLILIILTGMDGLIWPARLTLYPVQPQVEWVRWLGEQPDGSVVAHVPFPASGRTAAFEPTVVHMLYGLGHGHPMVNGYSGFFPPTYRLIAESMTGFPDAFSTSRLARSGVTHIVVDGAWLTPERSNRLEELGYGLAYSDGEKHIYRLP